MWNPSFTKNNISDMISTFTVFQSVVCYRANQLIIKSGRNFVRGDLVSGETTTVPLDWLLGNGNECYAGYGIDAEARTRATLVGN